MKTTSLIVALLTAGTLTVFGQEGTVQDLKHDAKKAGEKIKKGVETVGEKTKHAAETVGEKTKETAETVGRKTKETLESAGEKTNQASSTVSTVSRLSSRLAVAPAVSRKPNVNRSGAAMPPERIVAASHGRSRRQHRLCEELAQHQALLELKGEKRYRVFDGH